MTEMSTHVLKEAWNLLAETHIANGSARTVWTSALADVMNPSCVVKVEDVARSFQNVTEWQTWQYVQGSKYAKWFAPCYRISPCGSILLMAKTTVPGMSDLPEMMPSFLCDFKRTNYGMFDGRLVCHDYGLPIAFLRGMTLRMRKANWTDGVESV